MAQRIKLKARYLYDLHDSLWNDGRELSLLLLTDAALEKFQCQSTICCSFPTCNLVLLLGVGPRVFMLPCVTEVRSAVEFTP